MKSWRPGNWEEYRRKENIYPEAKLWGHLFEAGADAMLDALFRMAQESPTGTFVLDSNVITICQGKEGVE